MNIISINPTALRKNTEPVIAFTKKINFTEVKNPKNVETKINIVA